MVLGSVNHYFVRCVVVKIVSGKTLAAAHIENMRNSFDKFGNVASGDFDHNPEGRDDLAPVSYTHLTLPTSDLV